MALSVDANRTGHVLNTLHGSMLCVDSQGERPSPLTL